MEFVGQTILAIDFGSSHVGVALYTPSLGVTALKTIRAVNGFELRDQLLSLVTEYGATVVVVGDMGLDALPEEFSKIVEYISVESGVPVTIVSERFTSKQADKELYEEGAMSSQHARSAELILREFLSQ